MKHIAILFTFLALSWSDGIAQLLEIPLQINQRLVQEYISNPENFNHHLDKSGGPLGLPFFEDFNSDSPLPDPAKWEDNLIYVNNTMGNKPPSIGVATFDGLDAFGQPYYGGSGPSDTLTSRPIDLSPYSSNDDIYLSLFVQAKGNGEKPEPGDSLVLEFKTNSGGWVQIAEYAGLSGVAPDFIPPFEQNFYPITAAQYLHDNFQFRFRNYSANTGFVDVWNLDYIQIDTNRSPTDSSTDDIAFIDVPQSILNTYTSMPFDQFRADIPGELELGVVMDITNHFGTGKSIDQRTISATELNSGAVVMPTKNFGAENFTPGQNLTFSDQLNLNTDFDFATLPNQASLANGVIETEFVLQAGGQGADYLANDRVQIRTYFEDYFAYDDGSAEASVVAQGQGTQVVQAFHSNVDDTIKAVQFHFQHVQAPITSQTFNLKIWINSLDNDEDFDMNFLSPSHVDSLNGFTTYVLDEQVLLQSGDDFYVGWQQFSQTSNPIPVGFDKNNPEASTLSYFKTGADDWQPFPATFSGALMIRPVMGGDPLVSTIDPPTVSHDFKLFPNPVSEILKVEVTNRHFEFDSFSLFDLRGIECLTGNFSTTIDVSDLPDGTYIILLDDLNSGQRSIEKFVKIK